MGVYLEKNGSKMRTGVRWVKDGLRMGLGWVMMDE